MGVGGGGGEKGGKGAGFFSVAENRHIPSACGPIIVPVRASRVVTALGGEGCGGGGRRVLLFFSVAENRHIPSA